MHHISEIFFLYAAATHQVYVKRNLLDDAQYV